MKAVGDELTKALARAEAVSKNITKDVKETAKAFNKASVEADILAKKTQIAKKASFLFPIIAHFDPIKAADHGHALPPK
jgi:hypothetical protein